MKNPYQRKAVLPFFFITPDHVNNIKDPALKKSAMNSCKTAFCTPKAEMVFNREFSEKLALFAILKGEQPQSKKYSNNGGPIPYWYCYLEFIMIHELLHFAQADHFYTDSMVKRIKSELDNII